MPEQYNEWNPRQKKALEEYITAFVDPDANQLVK